MAWIYHETNQLGSMTLEEMQNNAEIIRDYLTEKGWTLNAICGLLGNIQKESYINPAQWQGGYPIGTEDGGYGLVQWTPSTKYTNWCRNAGYSIYDGYAQIKCIDEQSYGREWYPSKGYEITYDEFKQSTQSPQYLALVFLKNYERAVVEAIVEREQNAYYWYQYFYEKPPVPPTPTTKKKLSWIYYIRRKR